MHSFNLRICSVHAIYMKIKKMIFGLVICLSDTSSIYKNSDFLVDIFINIVFVYRVNAVFF